MSGNFNTSNDTLRKLLGNGLSYAVPSFQRDYSWGQEEWEELWEDIQALEGDNAESEHYMGYLVLQSSDSRNFDIIDGQQRITTISIIVLAAISHLQDIAQKMPETAGQNNLRADQLRMSYIGYLDTETLVNKSKLRLNRHNDYYYQTYIVPLERMPERGIRASEQRLRRAFIFFKARISEYSGNNGEAVARIINIIVDKLFFTVISVTDELNAFKVFETLNARGVKLSSPDLLKNYLFSMVASRNTHQHELDRMEQQWERIVNTLELESFPDFLRVFWNSRYKFSRKFDLFKAIRSNITTRETAFKLLRDMDIASSIFVALKQPSDSLWGKDEKKYLTHLKTFSLTQHLPFLLACYEKFAESNRELFVQVLRAVEVISFRYNIICGLNPNEQYVRIAKAVMDGKLLNKHGIFNELRSMYPDDKHFSAAFEEKEFVTSKSRGKKILRYILFELEKNASHQSYDIEDDSITIEHICPASFNNEEWTEETLQQVHRIGNTTLLKATENRKIGNGSYLEKLPVYQNSNFHITQSIAEHYEMWNEEKIASRQRQLAKKAQSIWKLQF